MIGVLYRLLKKVHNQTVGMHLRMAALFATLIVYSASGYMYFELPANPDLAWLDAFWWTIVTMTTVGYGDLFPASPWGRILVGFPAMLLGVSMLGYFLSVTATLLLESKMKEAKGMKDITLSDHIIICHYVSTEKILNLLHEIRHDPSTEDAVLVIVDDGLDELPAELVKHDIKFVRGDLTREATLEQANVNEARAVIIQALETDANTSDNTNLRIGLTIEHFSPHVHTVVECMNNTNAPFFRRAKCDSVVCISSLTGQMLVQELQDPGVSTIVAELTSNEHGKQFYILDVPKSAASYADVESYYANDNSVLIGIRRSNQNILLPEPDFRIETGDSAIMIAAGRPAT